MGRACDVRARLLALVAFVLCKVAYDLHGRRAVSVEQELGFAASLALALVGLVLLVRCAGAHRLRS